MRLILTSLVVCCLVGSGASAQTPTPAKMIWQAGQVYSYKIEHATQAMDSVGDSKSETKSEAKSEAKPAAGSRSEGGKAAI